MEKRRIDAMRMSAALMKLKVLISKIPRRAKAVIGAKSPRIPVKNVWTAM
jgi:hypothetical protein